MNHRETRKQKLLIMGMVVLALMAGCPDSGSEQEALGAVSGLSPADESTTWETAPTFSWTEVPDAAGYELRIADSKDGLASAVAINVTGTSHTPESALTSGQTHYWQVRAKGEADQFGAWSDANSLRVESDAVSGLSPADGSSTPDTAPTFSWGAVPKAAGYELQLADSTEGVEGSQTQSVTDASYTPSSALEDKKTHYWRVRAKDGDGQYGPWSNIFSIQIGYNRRDTGPAGGIVFYDKGSYTDGWRYLEAAPSDQSTGIQWGGIGIKVDTETAIGTGKANTEKIVTTLGRTDSYAARLCDELEYGGFEDWFLPSLEELDRLRLIGLNDEGFALGDGDYYWSSTESESSANHASAVEFSTGADAGKYKHGTHYVRAVRAF